MQKLCDLIRPIRRCLDLIEANPILPDGEHDEIAVRRDIQPVAAIGVEHLAELATDAKAGLQDRHRFQSR